MIGAKLNPNNPLIRMGLIADPRTLKGTRRDPKWSALCHKLVAAAGGRCAACGRVHKPNGHHKVPYHVDPSKELDPDNVIILGEGGTINCHLWLGHCGRWDTWNPHVVEDAVHFRAMVEEHLGPVAKGAHLL